MYVSKRECFSLLIVRIYRRSLAIISHSTTNFYQAERYIILATILYTAYAYACDIA